MVLLRDAGIIFSRGANRSHSIFLCEKCGGECLKETYIGLKNKTCGCKNRPMVINGVEIVRYLDSVKNRTVVEYVCDGCGEIKSKLAQQLKYGNIQCRECGYKQMSKTNTKYKTEDEKRLSFIHTGMVHLQTISYLTISVSWVGGLKNLKRNVSISELLHKYY